MPDIESFLHGTQVAAYVLPFVGVGLESLGVPIPGETSLIAAAILASHGHGSVVGVGVAGFAGAVLGDNAGYYVGRRWGTRLIKAPVIRRLWTAERIAKADSFFGGKHASLAVAGGRWIALLRIFAGPLAGMHKMPWRRFFIANVAGAACWVTAISAGAFVLGSNAHSVATDVAVGGLGAIGLSAAGHALFKRHQRQQTPVVTPANDQVVSPPPAAPQSVGEPEAGLVRRPSVSRVAIAQAPRHIAQ